MSDITALTGKNVFIRTVTNYYTGHLISADGPFLHLGDAAWIADTGRFANALATGQLSEVEPYGRDAWIAAGAITDISEWPHDLPLTQK